ncbi:hypothetical protein Tco_0774122 [Tanacetum coccineum]|uniref:Uncharacterized protein n=1 Tax=Tanacetum coccineum TaxID=301880 RepID=A0ABQ4ZQ74_9ASTR
MAQLKYCDKHNQVGFLPKPNESAGFTEIVDFLRGSHLRYALTTNPTIYDSLVKQFWQTATAKTLADGTLELHATIDTIAYTITKASIRSKLQLANASGITMLPNNEIFEGMGHIGSKSGGWDQFGSNIATALICLSTGRVYNFSKLIFDGMVANLKSKTKFLMYPRFLQMILDIQTENKHPYLAVTLTKKIFGNMKRGFRGVPRPLLPAMLSIANPSAGQEAPSVTQPQPSSSVVPPTPPTTQHIPSEATTIPPLSQPAPIAETTTASPLPTPSPAHEPMEHTFEQPLSDQQPPTPRQEATTSQLRTTDDDTLEVALKRKTKRVLLSDFEEEETEAHGRKFHDLDPLVSLVQELVTPSKTPSKTVNAFRGSAGQEAPSVTQPQPSSRQEAPSVTQPQPSSSVVPPTSPTTQPIPFEAIHIPPLSQHAPPTPIAETTTASPSPSPSPAHEPIEHTFEQPSSDQQPPTPRQEANTSQLMTRIDDLEKQLKETKQTFRKAILTLVESVKTLEVALKRKTKRVLLSDSKEEETEAQGRKTHDLDPLVSLVQELITLSKTVNASGEEQVEDISPITLEAAAILTKVKKIKSVDKGKRYKRRKSSKKFAGTSLDFEEVKSAFEKVNTGGIKVSSGIEEINNGSLDVNTGIDPVTTDSIRVLVPSLDKEDWDTIRAKLEANEELKESMLGKYLTVKDYAKRMVELNQGTWKLTQLKLNFEEVKAEFEKLAKQLDTYFPKNFEATKESLKRFGEELQTNTAKKLKFNDEGTQPTEENIEEDKDVKPTRRLERGGKTVLKFSINCSCQLHKSPSIANYKIIKQGRKGVYQIVRENGTDMVYISFGAMLTDISRDDLIELYRIVMKKHGMRKIFGGGQRSNLKRVHCLNLESADVYMLIERKYPLSAEVCKAMLDKKLQGGKPDEDCYKLLKMMEKQAGIRK